MEADDSEMTDTARGGWWHTISAIALLMSGLAALGTFALDARRGSEIQSLQAGVSATERQVASMEDVALDARTQSEEATRTASRALQVAESNTLIAADINKLLASLVASAEEHQRLRIVAGREDVQALFQPFLAEGTWKGAGTCSRWDDFPRPASLSLMTKAGKLADAKTFLATANNECNDRPAWSPPDNTPEGWAELEERLGMFKALGPIWVETGVLSK